MPSPDANPGMFHRALRALAQQVRRDLAERYQESGRTKAGKVWQYAVALTVHPQLISDGYGEAQKAKAIEVWPERAEVLDTLFAYPAEDATSEELFLWVERADVLIERRDAELSA